MAESIFDEINSRERMSDILDITDAPAAATNEHEAWLEDPKNERMVQKVWDQAMCLAFVDGNEAAAEWLKERVNNPKHKLPRAAKEFYEIYQKCKNAKRR